MTPFRFCLTFKTWRVRKVDVFILLYSRALHAQHIDVNISETEIRLGNGQKGESLTLTSVGEIDPNGRVHFLLRRSCLVGPLERSYFEKPRNNDKKCIEFNKYCA